MGKRKDGTKMRKKRKEKTSNYIILMICLAAIILFGMLGREFWIDITSGTGYEQGSQNTLGNDSGKTGESGNGSHVNFSDLYSTYAILVDENGTVIAEKDADARMYPASLTKIMTAIVAIERLENMDRVITVPADFFEELYAQNASRAGFEPGEQVTVRDLLYGVMLPSGAECCMTLAWEIAGSEAEFVKLMNEKAVQLGMDSTHFENSTGLHHKNHYTTARDMATLWNYALKNSFFRKMAGSAVYHTDSTNMHLDGITFYSTMFKKMDRINVKGGKVLGGKTGYTEEAGLCLASYAEVDGKEYLLVTGGADGDHQTAPFHILDALYVYDQLGKQ